MPVPRTAAQATPAGRTPVPTPFCPSRCSLRRTRSDPTIRTSKDRCVSSGMLDAMQEAKAMQVGAGRIGLESDDYPQVVPADFPPYRNLGRHTHLNYMGTGMDIRTETFLSVFGLGAGFPNPHDAVVPFPG